MMGGKQTDIYVEESEPKEREGDGHLATLPLLLAKLATVHSATTCCSGVRQPVKS